MTALSLTPGPDFHAERRTGVFATDLWRIHPAGGNEPLAVYREKIGEIEPWEGNKFTEAGHAFEAGIGSLCELDTGWTLRRAATRRHPTYKHLGCHLDFIVAKSGRGKCKVAVDAKFTTRGRPGDGEWGEPGSDKLPPRILTQLHHQIVAGELEVAHAYVFFGSTADRVLYTVEPDPEWRDMVLDVSNEFWNEHVIKRVPPAPGEGEFKLAFPKDNGTSLVLDEWTLPISQQAEELRQQIKALETRYATLRDELMKVAEDHRYLVDPEGTVLWDYRTVTPKAYDAHRTLARMKAENPDQWNHIMETYGTPAKPFRALYSKTKAVKEESNDE